MCDEISELLLHSKFIEQKGYWSEKLSQDMARTDLPSCFKTVIPPGEEMIQPGKIEIPLNNGNISEKLMKFSKKSDLSLYIVLITAVKILIYKYTKNEDITVVSPVYEPKVSRETINNKVLIRSSVWGDKTFLNLLLEVRQSTLEAFENQDYPFEKLQEFLFDTNGRKTNRSISNILCLLTGIHGHHHDFIENLGENIVLYFEREGNYIKGNILYSQGVYERHYLELAAVHLSKILEYSLGNVKNGVSEIPYISEKEKEQLLFDLNKTKKEYPYPQDKVVHQLFEEQVEKTPDMVALVYNNPGTGQNETIKYKDLNIKANQLAHLLKKRGVKKNSLVGIMAEPSTEMILGILSILKAGGAYLPIDPGIPLERLTSILEDSNISYLLTDNPTLKKYSFTALQTSGKSGGKVHITPTRPQITDLDSLPFVDRSLVNYEKYSNDIGHASVKHTITLQATRGCPYSCAYCHKIWPKTHVFRSAENIFNEVKFNYDLGIRRFTFIDDVFNLNKENSRKFFEMVIRSRLDMQFFFPNGVRGDILTREYIDLMVEAGTTGMSVALETASPRLQKLIGKNLNIERFRENIQYICKKYPQLLLVIQTMVGFPTETKKEAMMTLDFIKSLKWLDFPSINVLKVFPGTEMEKLALENGISPDAILRSSDQAYHQLPDTLPFEKEFVAQYQTDYLKNYFLLKERLLNVLPYQMKVMTEDELVQKYNSYLPVNIDSFNGLLEFTNISKEELGVKDFLDESLVAPSNFFEKTRKHFPAKTSARDALRILLLDLTQFFSGTVDMLYDVAEPPLGLMALMSYLNRQFGSKINGKIAKSRFDFDNYEELNALLEDFQPHVIGIRTLTFFREFFHKTAALVRQWNSDVSIISGGPYATSNYSEILKDKNIDLVVLGEGELTSSEVINQIIKNDGKLPSNDLLEKIPGIAFVPDGSYPGKRMIRKTIILDEIKEELSRQSGKNPDRITLPHDPAYVIYTSGSTGKPKGVMVSNDNLINYITWFSGKTHLSEKDRTLLTSSFAFDLGYTSIYSSIMGGAQLHIIPKELYMYPEDLISYINQHNITYMKMTPSLFKPITESLHFTREMLKSLRLMVLGGEAINTVDIEKAHNVCKNLQIMNHYGPTEATIGCIARFIDFEKFAAYKESPTIGQPINNTNVYILDKNLNLQSVGVSGELCISGSCLSRGYLNRPELTAEKFVLTTISHGSLAISSPTKRSKAASNQCPVYNAHSPLPLSPCFTIYRTGDLTRWLMDGNIQFLGRIDNQVKIRGFRIELGEIETQLAAFPNIKEAAVMVNENETGDQYLCSYLVGKNLGSDEKIDMEEVRKYLSHRLPDHMVPSYFIQIDNFPLTPNGKIDRKMLPHPEIIIGKDFIPPRNKVEKKLAELWSDILGIEKEIIGINSNFFDLGGHSLKAIMITAKIHKAFHVIIPLAEVFKTPTIKGLARSINELAQEKFISIEPGEEKEYYPLSSAQKRFFILHHLEEDSTTYHVPGVMNWDGEIHKDRLERAIRKLMERHQGLRTSFVLIDQQPLQRIHPPGDVTFAVEYYEITGNSDLEKKERIEKLIDGFISPFDFSRVPLFRVALVKTGADDYILVVDMHHIISDAISMNIMVEEFLSLTRGEEPPPLRLQYKDYSEWQNKFFQADTLTKQEEYWLKQFDPPPLELRLPLDYERPSLQSLEGARTRFDMDIEQLQALKKIASGENVTLFMLLLALCSVFLSKISSQEDIQIATPVAGRRHDGLEHIIGVFINILVLRKYPTGTKTFTHFLAEVKEITLSAFENQEYPFEELVNKVGGIREAGRNPLFDVMFTLHTRAVPGKETTDIAQSPYKISDNTAAFDLFFNGIETAHRLIFYIEYSTTLFKKETIERFIGYFREVVDFVIDNKDIRLEDIKISHHLLTTSAEKPQIEFDF